MGFFETRTCCFCVPPKTGILILTIIGIISCFAGMILLITNADKALKPEGSDEEMVRVPRWVSWTTNSIGLVLHALLLRGVLADKPGFILPSVVLGWIGLVLMALGSLSLFFTNGISIGPAIAAFLIYLALMIIPLHFLLITTWYYRDLCDKQQYNHPSVRA